MFLEEIVQNLQESIIYLRQSLFLIQFHAELQHATFLKERPQQRRFPAATLDMFIFSGFAGTRNFLSS